MPLLAIRVPLLLLFFLAVSCFEGFACSKSTNSGVGSIVGSAAASPLYPVTVIGNSFPSGGGYLNRSAPRREIEITRRPQRIVVAGPPLYIEILFDLDAGPRIVGVSESPDNPPEARKIQKIGRSMNWNLETLISLEPDVVFGASRWGARLEKLGIPVVTTGQPGGNIIALADVYETISTLDLAVNGEISRSKRLVAKLSEEIELLRVEAHSRPSVSTAFLYAPRQYTPTVAGRNTPEHELLQLANAKNVFDVLEGYKSLSLERLLAVNPDSIITSLDQVDQVLEDVRLQTLEAVRMRRVYGVASSRIASSRMPMVLRELMRKLHEAR